MIKNNPTIVDELSVFKNTTMGVKSTVEHEDWFICTSPIEGQVDLTPSKVIARVVARFKRKKVSTPMETGAPSSIMEALVMAFPILQLLTLLIKAAAIGPFTWAILRALNLRMFLLTLLP